MTRKLSLPASILLLLAACDEPATDQVDDAAVEEPDVLEELADEEAPESDLAPEPRDADEWPAQTFSLAPPEPVFNVLNSKSGFQIFTWKQGAGDVRLGSITDKSCFLAGLNGTLGSLSDVAEVEVIDGQWLLRGFGSVASASAVCVGTKFGRVCGGYRLHHNHDRAGNDA